MAKGIIFLILFLSAITLGRIATIHKARAGFFSCASGKRYMIGSPNILDKAIVLRWNDVTFQFYNFPKLYCLYAEHSEMISYL